MRLQFWRERTETYRPSNANNPAFVSSAPALDQDEEAALVCAAQNGNRAAFDALCLRHLPLLRGFIARRASVELIDDVVQETLLGAWMRIGHFEPNARFKTWLFQIALHKTIDANRARERKGRHEQSEVASLPEREPFYETVRQGSGGSGERRVGMELPGDRLEAKERRKAVLAALDKLPAGQREVVLLYFYAEMTLPEIAQATGRNLSTVKYQFYAAHAKIADLLKETPWAVESAPTEKRTSTPSNASIVCGDFAATGRKVRVEA